jgi:hypothetical protein
MKKSVIFLALIICVSYFSVAQKPEMSVLIVYNESSPAIIKMAAKEVRRYIYLRTGKLLPFVSTLVKNSISFSIDKTLEEQQYKLKSDGESLTITGGSDIAVLYGAYAFAEKLGVRFYLDGDVIPDQQISLALPVLDETYKPLFNLRGIQPFHDFPEGPDWWNINDYKAILGQLPKLGMNFFGLHTYPEGGVGPEPTVWIGTKDNFDNNGDVTFSYPSTYNNTFRNAWGYKPKPTGKYSFGASLFFESDTFGAAVQKSFLPWPKTPAGNNQLFNNTGQMLHEAFSFAHQLGIKTCVGTETPLIIPALVKAQLKHQGKDPESQEVVKELYNGIFSRISKSYHIDYYWLWTPEDWTWSGVADSTINKTSHDILTAYEALKETKSDFRLATCGWVLGPPKDRAQFDQSLPKDMPFSCISRNLGRDPVEAQFTKISGREKWAIPWMEEDPLLTQPQLWVGRMRKDAVDALKYNCNGLFGIHWRTRILGPNVSALAKAAWNQDNFKVIKSRGSEEIEVLGGNIEENPAVILNKNQQEQYLYRTCRTGLEGFNISLPDGEYRITFKMVEYHYKDAGKRIFNIAMQGKTVIENVDIAGSVGKYNGYDRIIENVNVDNGKLSIRFLPVKDSPVICALIIEGKNYSRKINCGGDDYLGYLSDVNIQLSTRYIDTSDFYLDWAIHSFGPEAAREIAEIFTLIDGRFPTPANWITGPGNIKSNTNNLQNEMKKYSFVEKLQLLQPKIKGAGNRDRFSYWLNTMKYYREMAKTGCCAGALELVVDEMKNAPSSSQKAIATQKAIPARNELLKSYSNMMGYLISTVTNMSELGTIMNIESLNMFPEGNMLNRYDSLLQKITGAAVLQPSLAYSGSSRIIVSTNRTSLNKGEDLYLKVIIPGKHDTGQSFFNWKTLGSDHKYAQIPLKNIGRDVYEVILPSADYKGNDLEYFVSTRSGDKTLVYPATAPGINSTVVIM